MLSSAENAPGEAVLEELQEGSPHAQHGEHLPKPLQAPGYPDLDAWCHVQSGHDTFNLQLRRDSPDQNQTEETCLYWFKWETVSHLLYNVVNYLYI